jgi:hypothetical protein
LIYLNATSEEGERNSDNWRKWMIGSETWKKLTRMTGASGTSGTVSWPGIDLIPGQKARRWRGRRNNGHDFLKSWYKKNKVTDTGKSENLKEKLQQNDMLGIWVEPLKLTRQSEGGKVITDGDYPEMTDSFEDGRRWSNVF